MTPERMVGLFGVELAGVVEKFTTSAAVFGLDFGEPDVSETGGYIFAYPKEQDEIVRALLKRVDDVEGFWMNSVCYGGKMMVRTVGLGSPV